MQAAECRLSMAVAATPSLVQQQFPLTRTIVAYGGPDPWRPGSRDQEADIPLAASRDVSQRLPVP